MNEQQKETLSIVEDKLASMGVSLEAMFKVIERSLYLDFSSTDTTREDFLKDYLNGVASIRLIQTASESLVKEQEILYRLVSDLNV